MLLAKTKLFPKKVTLQKSKLQHWNERKGAKECFKVKSLEEHLPKNEKDGGRRRRRREIERHSYYSKQISIIVQNVACDLCI